MGKTGIVGKVNLNVFPYTPYPISLIQALQRCCRCWFGIGALRNSRLAGGLWSAEEGGDGIYDDLGCAGKEVGIKRIHRIGVLMVVRISEVGGICHHHGSNSFLPEGRMIAAKQIWRKRP